MEKYTRVRAKKKEEEPVAENEIRVVAANKMRNYVVYAMKLLQQKDHKVIVLKAMGKAIEKTEAIADVLKHRVAGLHEITENETMDIVDEWEPKEEGLVKLEISRPVPLISITLSLDPLDKSHAGYKEPIPADQVKNVSIEDVENGTDDLDGKDDGSGRTRDRRNRGWRGPRPEGAEGAEGGGAPGGGRSRGRGRGRGRGGGDGAAGGEGGEGAAEGGEGGDGGGRGRGRGGGRRRRGGGRGQAGGAAGGESAAPPSAAPAAAPPAAS
eukprot:gene24456-10056_t